MYKGTMHKDTLLLLVGQVAQVARCLVTGWTARVQSRVFERWRFSLLLHVQTGPGVHSASYEMSTGAFPGGKGDRAEV